jgi:hypothetical protein
MFCTRLGSLLRQKEEVSLPNFPLSSLGYLTPCLFRFYVQRLAWDAIEVAKLREEVTQAWAAAVLAETRVTRVERMAQERVVLLATAHGEVDEAAQRVSTLEAELVGMR